MMARPDGSDDRLERVATMVEEAGAAALATDQDNRVVAWNDAARELLRAPGNNGALGAPLGSLLNARDVFGNRLCEDACALHAMVRNSESVQSFDLDLIRGGAEGEDEGEGDTTLRVAVSVVVVLSPDPERYHLVYFLRPRRQRRRADAAIDLILHGGGRVPSPVLEEVNKDGAELAELTERQTEVLRHIAEGYRTQQIADNLHISVNTVRNHTQNILRKLDVHSKTEAVSVALRQRLI